MEAILYIRKSTDKQEHSFEAQETRLRLFCAQNDWNVVEIVKEQASGADNDRELLDYAASRASSLGAKLVVLRVDRLSRSLSKVAELLERENLEICVAELGRCLDPFVVSIMACVAQQERRLISRRTKEALAILKAKGVKLGNPNLSQARANATRSIKSKADQRAMKWGVMINNLRLMNKSYREIGDLLNITSKKGNRMAPKGIQNLHKRYLALKEANSDSSSEG